MQLDRVDLYVILSHLPLFNQCKSDTIIILTLLMQTIPLVWYMRYMYVRIYCGDINQRPDHSHRNKFILTRCINRLPSLTKQPTSTKYNIMSFLKGGHCWSRQDVGLVGQFRYSHITFSQRDEREGC